MNAKKILCAVISGAMVLSTMSLPAFAEEAEAAVEAEEAVTEVQTEETLPSQAAEAELMEAAAETDAVIGVKNYNTGEVEPCDGLAKAIEIISNDTDGTYNPHIQISGNVVIDSDTTLPTRVVEYEDDWGDIQTTTKGGLYISGDCTLTVNDGVTLTALNIWVGDDVNFTINGPGTFDANIWTDWNGVGSLTAEDATILGSFEVYTYNGTTLNNCSVAGAYLDTDGPIDINGVTSSDDLYVYSYYDTADVINCEAPALTVKGTKVTVDGCTMESGFSATGETTVTNSTLQNGRLALEGDSADISDLEIGTINSGFTMTAGSVTPNEFNITGGTFKKIKVSSPVTATFNDITVNNSDGSKPIEVSGSADVTVNNGTINTTGNFGVLCSGEATLALNDCTINCGIENSSVSGAGADATCGLTVIGGKFKANTYSTKNKLETLQKYLPEGQLAVPSEESGYYDIIESSGENFGFKLTPADKINVSADKADGDYLDGTYITVTAEDNEYYAFDGWYVGEEKVSAEKTYKFMLRGNTEIYAKVNELAAFTAVEPVDKVYTVSTPEQLNYISYLSSKGHDFAGEIVKIVKDIDMTGVSFCPIGFSAPFKGTLIGEKTTMARSADATQNAVISNLTIDPNRKFEYCGLVGKTAGSAEIKNITLKDPDVASYFAFNYVGAIAGEGTGATIDNCEVIGGKVNGHWAGGIMGHSYGGTTVQNCTVDQTTMDSGWKSGGVVGYYAGNIEINNTDVTDYKSVGLVPSGALVGHSDGSVKMENVQVDNPKDAEGNKLSLVSTDYSDGANITITGEDTSIDVSNILYDPPQSKVTIEAGQFTCPITDNIVVEGSQALQDKDGNYIIVSETAEPSPDFMAEAVTVKFAPTDDPRVYDIVITAVKEQLINRLMSSELKFELTPKDGAHIAYEIDGSGHSVITNADIANGIYAFNFDGADNNPSSLTPKKEVVIGTVTFDGYGEAEFNAVTYDKAKVNTAKLNDNIVDTFVPEGGTGFGKLELPGEKLELNFVEPHNTLTVVVEYNNPVENQKVDYQDMSVTISSARGTTEYKLGFDAVSEVSFAENTDNVTYTVSVEVPVDVAYTVTVTGAGYRTARKNIKVTEDGENTVTFWNNVKDADGANYLAGDIVKDNNINIYDLSAVVSYFGTANDVTNTSTYAKYDLNRDGVIDSKDVAYVLVSWGK